MVSFTIPNDDPLATPRGVVLGLKLAAAFWLVVAGGVTAWAVL